jgi:hypothetical protein
MSSCSVADWEAIVARAVAQAKKGDAAARAWLSKQLGLDAPTRVESTVVADVSAIRQRREEIARVYDQDPEARRLLRELSARIYGPRARGASAVEPLAGGG